MPYHAYIMASASGVLYIGVTNDLERRVSEHQAGSIPGFSSKYKTTKLVYFEQFSEISQAIAREKQWKGWRRSKKVALIESINPTWSDLSINFHPIPKPVEPNLEPTPNPTPKPTPNPTHLSS